MILATVISFETNTLYTSNSSQNTSNTLYKSSSIAMTIIGVAVAQIDVKPTISLNSIVTSSWLFASIFSPKTVMFLRIPFPYFYKIL